MALLDLAGDEQSVILLLLDREIRRQGEQQKLDVNKRNPNYEAAAGAQHLINRLQNLRNKIDAAAAPKTARAPATPVAASPSDFAPVRPAR